MHECIPFCAVPLVSIEINMRKCIPFCAVLLVSINMSECIPFCAELFLIVSPMKKISKLQQNYKKAKFYKICIIQNSVVS